jgi:hypothetical protein
LHNHEKKEWTLWIHGSFDDVISDYVAFRDGTLGERYDTARLVGPYRCYSTTCPGCSTPTEKGEKVSLFHRHHWFISSVQHGHVSFALAAMEDYRLTTVFRHCHYCGRVKSNELIGHRTIEELYESGRFKRTAPSTQDEARSK